MSDFLWDKSTKRRIVFVAIFFLPLLLGMIGYLVYDRLSFPDAVFFSLLFYFLNNGSTPTNILVEIARWTAPLMTASGLLTVLLSTGRRMRDWSVYRRGNAVAVYGNPLDASILLRKLGNRGLDASDHCPKADHYILASPEKENYDWLREHQDRIPDDAKVYILCDMPSARRMRGRYIPYSDTETAARLYWRERFFFPDSAKRGHRTSVVLLGFPPLAQDILIQGLLSNIFAGEQRIVYHVFGDGTAFQGLYHELPQIQDPVVFHGESWLQAADIIRDAGRVLIFGDADTALQLLFAFPGLEADYLTDEPDAVETFTGQDRLYVFPWKERALEPDHILKQDLLEHAKRINLEYAALYQGAERTPEQMERSWEGLSTFLKYSNISAADYHWIQRQMLAEMGREVSELRTDVGLAEMFSELEHIRWCRFHYLQNWRYGEPENGKAKDEQLRVHRDLVPYDSLTAEEKRKDLNNVKLLFGMD